MREVWGGWEPLRVHRVLPSTGVLAVLEGVGSVQLVAVVTLELCVNPLRMIRVLILGCVCRVLLSASGVPPLWECRARGARTEIVLLWVERRVRGGEGHSKPTTG